MINNTNSNLINGSLGHEFDSHTPPLITLTNLKKHNYEHISKRTYEKTISC